MKVIRLPGCDEYILNRARDVLKLYYDPQMSDIDRSAMLDEYKKALHDLPKWSVAHGFDEWVKARHHRPPPGAIRDLANKELKRYSDVIESRRKMQEASEPDIEHPRPDPDRTKEILNDAGYTPERNAMLKSKPMAMTIEELDAPIVKRLHWTETADPDGPQMQALREERKKYGVKPQQP